MQASDYKCPSCSAPLMFKPESASWKCEYCFRDYTLNDLEKNEKEFEDLDNKETIDVDEYVCSNCGAKIITDENTTATFCVYCGNTSIIKNRLTGMLKPSFVIPFKTTKEEAINSFLKFKKGKFFAPKEFGQKRQIDKITGIYIPFWLYDTQVDGEVSGTATKVKIWHSGDYRYTKTDTYSVSRRGEASFLRVPADGASKFDDDLMDSLEPFDYGEIKDFTPAYLSGFLAEKYDVDSKAAYVRVKERVSNTIEDYLRNDIFGYTSVNVNMTNMNEKLKNTEYVLFPVWMLNIKYKDKMHTFAMNGQTGKMIGNVPIAWYKVFLWFIGVFLGISLLGIFLMSLS